MNALPTFFKRDGKVTFFTLTIAITFLLFGCAHYTNASMTFLSVVAQQDDRGERARPLRANGVALSKPEIILLGSSGYSAQLAGQLGLPFAFAHHFDTGGTLQALALYHQNFTPSPVPDRPYAIVTANVLTAPTAP